MSCRLLVAGLGHVLMSDDAIGPYCAAHLLANYTFPDDVDIADLGTPGLDLALHLSGADIVIAIDALRGVVPGTLGVFDHGAVLGGRAAPRLDSHAPALEASVAMAHLAGDRPFDVTLVGLGGASFEHGAGLSPIVRGRIGGLVERVLVELTNRGVAWRARAPGAPSQVWWEAPAGLRQVPA